MHRCTQIKRGLAPGARAGRRRPAALEEALHGLEGGDASERGELLQGIEEVSARLERAARRLLRVRVRARVRVKGQG